MGAAPIFFAGERSHPHTRLIGAGAILFRAEPNITSERMLLVSLTYAEELLMPPEKKSPDEMY